MAVLRLQRENLLCSSKWGFGEFGEFVVVVEDLSAFQVIFFLWLWL